MMVLVGNTKGGVGKSMMAVNLAAARAASGRKVWLVDGDVQASSLCWSTLRSEQDLPGIACSHYTDGKTLRAQVLQQQGDYDDIVFDCGGYDSPTLRAAMILADTLVIPFQPRAFDTWSLDKMASIIDEVNGIRDDLRILTFLNQADPGLAPSDNLEARQALSDYPQMPWVDASIVRRKAFPNASKEGRSVLEQTPSDFKACQEFKRLYALIFGDNAK